MYYTYIQHLHLIKVAILPLSKKLSEKSQEVYEMLSKDFMCDYDEAGSIGKRYRREDEIGTPYCVTVDFDTLEDGKVTVRDRDTMEQERVAIVDLKNWLNRKNKILILFAQEECPLLGEFLILYILFFYDTMLPENKRRKKYVKN